MTKAPLARPNADNVHTLSCLRGATKHPALTLHKV